MQPRLLLLAAIAVGAVALLHEAEPGAALNPLERAPRRGGAAPSRRHQSHPGHNRAPAKNEKTAARDDKTKHGHKADHAVSQGRASMLHKDHVRKHMAARLHQQVAKVCDEYGDCKPSRPREHRPRRGVNLEAAKEKSAPEPAVRPEWAGALDARLGLNSSSSMHERIDQLKLKVEGNSGLPVSSVALASNERRVGPPQNAGKNCFDVCGKSGGFCSFCGIGACCHRSGKAPDDPPECQGVTHQYGNFHSCVNPAHYAMSSDDERSPGDNTASALATTFAATTEAAEDAESAESALRPNEVPPEKAPAGERKLDAFTATAELHAVTNPTPVTAEAAAEGAQAPSERAQEPAPVQEPSETPFRPSQMNTLTMMSENDESPTVQQISSAFEKLVQTVGTRARGDEALNAEKPQAATITGAYDLLSSLDSAEPLPPKQAIKDLIHNAAAARFPTTSDKLQAEPHVAALSAGPSHAPSSASSAASLAATRSPVGPSANAGNAPAIDVFTATAQLPAVSTPDFEDYASIYATTALATQGIQPPGNRSSDAVPAAPTNLAAANNEIINPWEDPRIMDIAMSPAARSGKLEQNELKALLNNVYSSASGASSANLTASVSEFKDLVAQVNARKDDEEVANSTQDTDEPTKYKISFDDDEKKEKQRTDLHRTRPKRPIAGKKGDRTRAAWGRVLAGAHSFDTGMKKHPGRDDVEGVKATAQRSSPPKPMSSAKPEGRKKKARRVSPSASPSPAPTTETAEQKAEKDNLKTAEDVGAVTKEEADAAAAARKAQSLKYAEEDKKAREIAREAAATLEKRAAAEKKAAEIEKRKAEIEKKKTEIEKKKAKIEAKAGGVRKEADVAATAGKAAASLKNAAASVAASKQPRATTPDPSTVTALNGTSSGKKQTELRRLVAKINSGDSSSATDASHPDDSIDIAATPRLEARGGKAKASKRLWHPYDVDEDKGSYTPGAGAFGDMFATAQPQRLVAKTLSKAMSQDVLDGVSEEKDFKALVLEQRSKFSSKAAVASKAAQPASDLRPKGTISLLAYAGDVRAKQNELADAIKRVQEPEGGARGSTQFYWDPQLAQAKMPMEATDRGYDGPKRRQRVYVFGLDGSGTRYVSRGLSRAVDPRSTWDGEDGFCQTTRGLDINHVSLPGGSSTSRSSKLPLKQGCDGQMILVEHVDHCEHVALPTRWFANITAILEADPDSKGILLTRESEARMHSALQACPDQATATAERDFAQEQVDLALKAVPRQLLTARYEDFGSNLEAQWRRIYDYLGWWMPADLPAFDPRNAD